MTQINREDWFHGVVVNNPYRYTYRHIIMDLSDGRHDARSRVKALQDKKIITKEESDNLHNMINSEDLENLEVAKCILDEKERIKVQFKSFIDKLKFWK